MTLSKKQHKYLLEQALQGNATFKSFGDTMPCSIVINSSCYNIYIKNLTSAHFKTEQKESDVWRAQLPSNEKFAEMKESPIPFIFLGYDEKNDVYATWNPHKVKQRLNEAKYVSFYSRLSAQKEANEGDKFVRLKIRNDGEVLIFPRLQLSTYLVDLETYFADMSDYVAIGSKRRTEANDAYRELNNTKNLRLYAKYLEDINFKNISIYCDCLKKLINKGYISKHRKDFLAFDTIDEYDSAIERFMQNDDIIELDKMTDGCIKNVLLTYWEFLKSKLEKIDEVNDNKDKTFGNNVLANEKGNNTSELEDYDTPFYNNGKITKIINPEVLQQIEPSLNTEYPSTVVAVNILKEYYSKKFELQMEFKDWIKLIKNIDWSTYNDKYASNQKKENE